MWGQSGGFGVSLIGFWWGSNRLPWNAAGFSSVMLSSGSLVVKCCVSVVVMLGCVRCRCGSSIGCCGGSVWKCVCVVFGVDGVWAGGGAVVPSRCFLWWSEVSLCACCLIAWGTGLF